MTVGEIKRQLDQCSDDQQVIFTPGEYCGEGYPEWESAIVSTDHEISNGKPFGVVTISLEGERP